MRRSLLLMFVAGCSVDQTAAKPGDDLSVSSLADLSMISSLADLAGAAARDLRQIAGAYPAGPYGNKVGDTFPPLTWEGYADPLADALATTKPFGPYTMDNVRLSGRAYAMLHISDYT